MARRRLTPAQPGYLAPVQPVPKLGDGADTRVAPIAQVSGQSAEAAALREVTQNLQTARDEGRMVVDVPLSDVSPGYLIRDRISVDRDEMDALKASIRAHGQRVPAEITPLATTHADGAPAHTFGLIAGWRRLIALNELHLETGDPQFSTLRALIRPATDAAESYVAMVEENEIRVGLSYFERARMVSELTQAGVFPDQSSALRTLFASASRAKRSKIGSFVDLVEALGDVLSFPGDIPERLGLALVSRLRLEGQAARTHVRAALVDKAPGSAEAELALLEKLARPSRPVDVSRAKQDKLVLCPGVTMAVSGSGKNRKLVLSGAGVTDDLIARLSAALGDGPSGDPANEA